MVETNGVLIDALEQALEKDPGNDVLRLHVAAQLLEAGEASGALAHCGRVLECAPDQADALHLAARATDALAHKDPAPDPPQPIPLRVIDGGRAGAPDHADVERPTLRLADVAGMEDVKRQLELSFLGPLRNPELGKTYGMSLQGGLLLYGPPGCGKTHVARAVAGELGARFLSVGLTDVLDMWMGESESNLKQVFDLAREKAPCVVFLDEVDALGQRRSHLKHSAMRSVVVSLLAELDGGGGRNDGVYVLAATNHPWDVDPAFRRPGRLDRMLLVLPPDLKARRAIAAMSFRDRPTENLNLDWLAHRSEGFSGADVAHLCRAASELAMEEAVAAGETRPIGMAHVKHALKEVRQSTEAWFETARNFALYANDGGIYDDLLSYLGDR